jgi:hypothetical protein
MSTKSREVIFGSRIRGAKIHAENARQSAKQAVREADRAEAEAWSIRMEGYGGPAQPSPTIAQCLNGGLGWLEVECNRCLSPDLLPDEKLGIGTTVAGEAERTDVDHWAENTSSEPAVLISAGLFKE